jgi:hypothetical protein
MVGPHGPPQPVSHFRLGEIDEVVAVVALLPKIYWQVEEDCGIPLPPNGGGKSDRVRGLIFREVG